MSHPKVSHQVETNVVTQANRPPVPSRDSDPAALPRATANDRQNSVLGRVFRASVHPTAGRIVGGSVLVLATHGSVPGQGKAAGRPLILQGSYPAGAPGGAWPKVRVADPGICDFMDVGTEATGRSRALLPLSRHGERAGRGATVSMLPKRAAASPAAPMRALRRKTEFVRQYRKYRTILVKPATILFQSGHAFSRSHAPSRPPGRLGARKGRRNRPGTAPRIFSKAT